MNTAIMLFQTAGTQTPQLLGNKGKLKEVSINAEGRQDASIWYYTLVPAFD